MSTYIFWPPALLRALERLTDDNAQGEYYLTDCPGVLKESDELVLALPALQPCESLSINTPQELAIVETEMKKMECSSSVVRGPLQED
jgi:bifunctional UDP-N-acetylglucosamine pyrophosphorylase/glucosamine-1-phosphate N-acetyltransferase/UDP-N-acetylglucosamine pyrophosphorylase